MNITAPRWARWVITHAGRRGAFLAFLTVLDVTYGAALLNVPPEQLAHFDFLLPIHTWGWIWCGVGAIIATGILARRDRVQYSISAMFKAVWCFLYVYEWIEYGAALAWASVSVWGAFCLVVILVAGWPEPPRLQ